MAPSATDNNSKALTKTKDDDLTAMGKDNANAVVAYGRRQINRVVSFDTRQKAYGKVSNFARERPFLFAFIVAQLVFSSLPIVIFSAFTISTIVLALGAAVIFALFWIGVALLVLVPTLFFTCSVAILAWTWAIGFFLLAQWLYEMSPVSGKGEIQVDLPKGKKYAVTKNEEGVDGRPEQS